MTTLDVQAAGLFTAVGLDARQTLGSLRTRVQRFEELAIEGPDNEAIVGAATPLPLSRFFGPARLVAMGAEALAECARGFSDDAALLLCCPEPEDVSADWEALTDALVTSSGAAIDRGRSRVFPAGHSAVVEALAWAEALFARGEVSAAYVGGVDSLLDQTRLLAGIEQERVKHGANANGFVPGEAAAFVRVAPGGSSRAMARVAGVGAAREAATRKSGDANRALGLTAAMRAALGDAGAGSADVSVVAHDGAGERYYASELTLSLTRLCFRREQRIEVLDTATCVGEVGAAAGPLVLAFLAFLLQAGAGTTALGAMSSEGGARGAFYLTRSEGGDRHG